MARKPYTKPLSKWRPQLVGEPSEPKSTLIGLGGQEVRVYEMTLAGAQGVLQISLPHIRSILGGLSSGLRDDSLAQQKDVVAKAAEEGGGAEQVQTVLESLRSQATTQGLDSFLGDGLMEAIVELPVDLINLLALMINIDPDGDQEMMEFMYGAVRVSELPGLFEAIGELNDFSTLINRLIGSFQNIARNYGLRLPEAEIKKVDGASDVPSDVVDAQDAVQQGGSVLVE